VDAPSNAAHVPHLWRHRRQSSTCCASKATSVGARAAIRCTSDLVTLDFDGPTAWRDGCTLNRISLVVSPGGGCMRRRDFIQVIAGSVAAWPLAARAQQADRVRRVGVLLSTGADDPQDPTRLAAFAQGLHELGWTVGRNLRIDHRWGAGDAD